MFPVLFLTAAAICIFQWKIISTLRGENQELTARVQAAQSQMEADAVERLAQQEAEVKQLRAQAQELPRLRNEVRQLRANTNELARLRVENQQLNAKGRNATPGSTGGTEGANRGVLLAKENWVFAGYASPDAALQSAVWAMNQGDMKTFLASLTPEAKSHMEKEWETKTEAEISAKGREEMNKTTGYRILERKAVSESEMALSVFIEGENRTERISMKKIGNEWKFAGP
ncbi:MAG: hypothetical protein JWQ71_3263 [Pedosphaera sp.]|nr:hypothetical protein [Pedosphaera sp.]